MSLFCRDHEKDNLHPLFFISLGCLDKKNCKNAICTQIFAMATVQINIPDTIPVSEIGTQTLMLSSANVIHTQSGPASFGNMTFTVADDSDLKELGLNSNQGVELKILRNGNVIKSVPFVISTDCCHVTKSEGPDVIDL